MGKITYPDNAYSSLVPEATRAAYERRHRLVSWRARVNGFRDFDGVGEGRWAKLELLEQEVRRGRPGSRDTLAQYLREQRRPSSVALRSAGLGPWWES